MGRATMSDKTKDVILLVEDNPDDRDLTIRALRKNRVVNEIVVARDGSEALVWLFDEKRAAAGHASLPTMILLDLKLPKVNGLEVLAAIRENDRTRNLPVVVLTSSDEERDMGESQRLGATYIRKSVDFTEFREVIRRVIKEWPVQVDEVDGSVKK